MEASEEKRNKYLEAIKDIPTSNLVYLDESGIEVNICKERGWGRKGKKLLGKKSGKYYERTNIAGYVDNKSIAPMVFNGSCNTELFEDWVEQFLIKELKPGQFVVMDNAAFGFAALREHRSQKTSDLIGSVGCQIIFPPPYSSDLNPIEKFWANMKQWIKQNIGQFSLLFDALSCFFAAPNST